MRTNKIIRQIIQAVIFLANQGIPFRGDVKGYRQTKTLAISWLFSRIMLPLMMFCSSITNLLGQKNATYLSPITQNGIINVIGYDLILTNIISEVKDATFYSVSADEVTSHNVEHLPICVRFVDKDFNIIEELVAFLKLARVRAVDIAEAITENLTSLGLSLDGLRGQGYDGASTMSGVKSGVQARIRGKTTKCNIHSLYRPFL